MDTKKRILINTYDTAFQNTAGGVHNRIDRTVKAIRSANVLVDYFDKFNTVIDDYDVLHVFMLNVESYGLIKLAKAKGKKVVISSIVTLSGKLQLSFYWLIRRIPVMTTYKILFDICRLANSIIVETHQEAEFINKYYHVEQSKIHIIPNGADAVTSESKVIYDFIGKKCEYALEVGRFDNNKNQLSVIHALKNTDVEVVFVGGASPSEPDYYERCVIEANGAQNIHFLGWIDSKDDILKSAYANAKVLISSSFYETFGLSIVEGAMAGNIPVVSQTLPILEYEVFKKCITFDPNSIDDIREKIEYAMRQDKSPEFKKAITESFSWEKVANDHIGVYNQ